MVERGAGCGSHASTEQTDFAKIISTRQISKYELATGIILRNFYEPDAHQIKAVRRIALPRDHLPGREARKFDTLLQMLDKVSGKVREHRHAAQMILERSFSIILIDLCAKGFVLQHDVKNVAEHFVRDYLRFGPHRRRTRVEIHARHFAE